MEHALTPAENAADQAAEAAMRAHAEFLAAHWRYFVYVGRLHPLTGLPACERQPALDREAHRLHMLAAEANRRAAQVEYATRFPAP